MKSTLAFIVLGCLGFLTYRIVTEGLDQASRREAVRQTLTDLTESQQEQIDALIEENARREESVKALLAEKLEAEKQYFIISHFPFPGEPWTIEKYWVREELWIALQSYSSRTAAEDIKTRLESGELKTRDLFR